MQQIITDSDFGQVVLRKNSRSYRYTIRIRSGKVSISLPVSGSYEVALDFLNTKRKEVKLQQQKHYPVNESTQENSTMLLAQAHRYLPNRLRELAVLHQFQYTTAKINNSKTRWGSCSSRKSINLSYRLMTLPTHLIDYVLLHELCHTVQMNHGPEFWKLMNKVCDGKALQLRKELKQIK